MIAEGFEWQVQALRLAAHDVATATMDHRKAQYAAGARDVLSLLLGESPGAEATTLGWITERYMQRMEAVPAPPVLGHVFEGYSSCSKCGLLPLDDDDRKTDCPADVKPVNTESEER